MAHLAGEVARASQLVHEFTDYTPTLSNWTLGNGTLTGSHFKQGDKVHAIVSYTIGSTDTISGTPLISLPFTADNPSSTFGFPIGQALLFDTSANARRSWAARLSGTTDVTFSSEAFSTVDATTPWTWATGDEVAFYVIYRAA